MLHLLITGIKLNNIIDIWQANLNYTTLPILMYHSIGGASSSRYNLSTEAFERQINFLSSNFKIIRLSEIKEKLVDNLREINQPQFCVITFDDAYQNIIKNVHAIMLRKRIPYTIFVPTDYIGRKTEWMDVSDQVLNATEIKVLHESGLVDFGSHTASHQSMELNDLQKKIFEAKKSKLELESLLGVKCINMFSYPYGGFHDFSCSTTEVLQNTGYKIAVTTIFNSKNSIRNLLTLRRIQLVEYDSNSTILAKLNGDYDWYMIKEYLIYNLRRLFSVPVR